MVRRLQLLRMRWERWDWGDQPWDCRKVDPLAQCNRLAKTTWDVKAILVDWYRCLLETRRSQVQIPDSLVVTGCELLRLEDCMFAPPSCKCYGNLS